MGFSTPGAIDLHSHLREPGNNTAETIRSGTEAAVMGGFVMVADMPNNPGAPVHTLDRLVDKQEIVEREAWIPVGCYAGAQPETYEPGKLREMARYAIGVKFYATKTTGNENEYEAADFNDPVKEWHDATPVKPIMLHPSDANLEDMIGLVAQDNNHPLHVCHVNSEAQVNLVLAAKAKGLPVTSGVTGHHLLKTSHDVHTQGVFAQMMPPLAHQDEAEKLLWLLAQGKIDIIETDFAPHSLEAKFNAEKSGGDCFGVPGIEHVLPLMFYQMRKDRISEQRLMQATFEIPASIIGVKFDSDTFVEWVDDGAYRIGEGDVIANCGWSPYMGMLAIGKVGYVSIGGMPVVLNGKPYRPRPEVVENPGHLVI